MEECEKRQGEPQLTRACPENYLKADGAHFLHFTLDRDAAANMRQRA